MLKLFPDAVGVLITAGERGCSYAFGKHGGVYILFFLVLITAGERGCSYAFGKHSGVFFVFPLFVFLFLESTAADEGARTPLKSAVVC